MKAVVDRDTCIACGLCEEICPEVFEPDDEDIAVVKADPVPVEAEATCRQAAEECPVEAISLEE
jgi:ferredoxin